MGYYRHFAFVVVHSYIYTLLFYCLFLWYWRLIPWEIVWFHFNLFNTATCLCLSQPRIYLHVDSIKSVRFHREAALYYSMTCYIWPLLMGIGDGSQGPTTRKIFTKKISQFLFLGMEDFLVLYPPPPPPPPPPIQDKKKITHIFPEKIYSIIALTTVPTLFSSIKPWFYHISTFELIYGMYTILLANYLSCTFRCAWLFLIPFYRVNVCLCWVNNRVLSLVSNSRKERIYLPLTKVK